MTIEKIGKIGLRKSVSSKWFGSRQIIQERLQRPHGKIKYMLQAEILRSFIYDLYISNNT